MTAQSTETDPWTALLSKRLIFISGKGGVGKSVTAAAAASFLASKGHRTLLISSDGRGDAAALFGFDDPGYTETSFKENLSGLTASFDHLLEDFIHSSIPIWPVANRILDSATFRYFTRATPGLPDLLLLGKIRHIFQRRMRATGRYDSIVVDCPATGHAISMLALPRTILKTVPGGPVRKLGSELDHFLSDPAQSALVVVCEPSEFAAREAEELSELALKKSGLKTALLVVNRLGRSGSRETLPRLELPAIRIPEIPFEYLSPVPGPHGHELAFFRQFEQHVSASSRSASLRPASSRKPFPKDTWDLIPLLRSSRLLVLLGPGGVGKTTISAAAALAAARMGRSVMVLTVDPAKRLAQALGIDSTQEPVTVNRPDIKAPGRLMALQIDARAVFDRLLKRIASPEAVARIQTNRLYDGLVDSLPGVLEYMGVEALYEHSQNPELDLLVLDTPPAARGIDFLEAPRRMVELLSNDALRWFLKDDSVLGRALSGAARGTSAVLRVADKLLGLGFLADMADFFRVFDGLYSGFRERSLVIQSELERADFALVSSLDHSALRTAASLAETMRSHNRSLGLFLNRVPPRGAGLGQLAPVMAELPFRVIHELQSEVEDIPATLADILEGTPRTK